MTDTKLIRLMQERGVKVVRNDGTDMYHITTQEGADLCKQYEYRIAKFTKEQMNRLREV